MKKNLFIFGTFFFMVVFIVSCDQLNSLLKSENSDQAIIDPHIEREFYPNGQLKFEFHLDSTKKRHGEGKIYYESGKIKDAFKYNHGEKIWAASYFKNGNIAIEIPYKNNKRDGIRRKYYENGQLESEMPYKNDKIGKGLKEYTKSGKLKEKYPKLRVQATDKTSINGTYELEVYFDENPQSGTYYLGRLEEGYLNSGLVELKRKDKRGFLEYRVPPGFFLMEKIYFVGEYKTPTGNKFITEITYNLAIESQF